MLAGVFLNGHKHRPLDTQKNLVFSLENSGRKSFLPPRRPTRLCFLDTRRAAGNALLCLFPSLCVRVCPSPSLPGA